ncbi:Flp pilus assembly protein TadC [Roseovarius mucosus DSM 17069]|uniref:Flp pilus assembly protein TadC n=1 Tax=Roseovarius mucosus DSM 17069 TaxID=1288298 RepID=A0A0A0HLG6_9RHOB|nr:type II secretion system F family protein [Roseovarius mucosus]KGM88035.1 Flp pilus assembly protein TadC [Roseovarius mucosus DSM 17069]MAO00060.1 pilus assembly protein TadC [Roseovarius sp.]|tara:strand:+ start:1644 stop:2630 length:987 start_codon:yes stop_codon:yes gene_type:complete
MQILSVLNDVLTGALGPFGPLIAVGGLGVMLILITIPMMLRQKQDPLEKLKQANQRQSAASGGGKTNLRAGKQNKKLDRYATFLEPQDAKQLSQVRLKLMQAGYRHRDAVRYFHFAQFALAVGLLILGVIYYVLFKAGTETSTQETLLYILGPAGIGYMMPKYWVTKRQQKRQEEIQDGFPDSLDMMLVCIEAGQSMDQSIIRVASEMRASYPALAEEFEIVALQIKAGRDKPSVLGEMAERCGVQDISSFVTVLVQSQTFGTSIGEALRVYAGEMRDKRVMRAEEKANKLPTKMTLATMMLTVPPLLIILVGPSVLGIMELLAMSQK